MMVVRGELTNRAELVHHPILGSAHLTPSRPALTRPHPASLDVENLMLIDPPSLSTLLVTRSSPSIDRPTRTPTVSASPS